MKFATNTLIIKNNKFVDIRVSVALAGSSFVVEFRFLRFQ